MSSVIEWRFLAIKAVLARSVALLSQSCSNLGSPKMKIDGWFITLVFPCSERLDQTKTQKQMFDCSRWRHCCSSWDGLSVFIHCLRIHVHKVNFCLFCKNVCEQIHLPRARTCVFYSYQILLAIILPQSRTNFFACQNWQICQLICYLQEAFNF